MQNDASMGDIENLRVSVLSIVKPDQTIDDIENLIDMLAVYQKIAISPEQKKALVSDLQSHKVYKMGLGVELVSKDHKPWLAAAEGELEWRRWKGYATYLRTNKGMNPAITESMGARTSKILDLAGDPREGGTWSRKGLVIGDVQSGKTSNYLALFNKAADAGYRVFILLAGDKERLRAQTQERVDEGFIGRDSKFLGRNSSNHHATNNFVGVGEDPSFVPVNSLTSYHRDFQVSRSEQIQNLNDTDVPYVFVIKKNKAILDNLSKFLEASAGSGKKIKAPLLLVDDEADYASVNTSKDDSDPTVINAGIRRLLETFDRSSYVGFTATPFANVLIDDADEQDLFPRNFIYALESPTNYFGPKEMFDENSQENSFMVSLADAEDFFPSKHKKSLEVTSLPQSLDDAILSFYISNAIRDLRVGQATAPRSMLINVSRFKDVQRQVFLHVQARCSEINSTLEVGIGREQLLSDFSRVFDEHFSHIRDEHKSSVLAKIPASSRGVEVFIVNSEKGNSDWVTAFDGPAPRVIAVGGDVLSRGLTLEGLSVSYFYRRSLAYDTVMQMGRWFGYRDGYRDICKLWIDNDVSMWFMQIADALDELRLQLEQMHSTYETPETYGLAVRCHPGRLLTVTALNKMRKGEKRPIRVSLWGTNPETIRFVNSPEVQRSNLIALEKLINTLQASRLAQVTDKKKSWSRAPQAAIGEFMRGYVAPKADITFGADEFWKFVSNPADERLAEWDVVLASGIGDEVELAKIKTKQLQRLFMSSSVDESTLIVGMGNSRLGSYGDVRAALSEFAIRNLPEVYDPSGSFYARKLDRPLLIIYPIQAVLQSKGKINTKAVLPNGYTDPVIGFGVAFPANDLEPDLQTGPEYMLNTVYQRTNSTLFDIDEPEEYEDD